MSVPGLMIAAPASGSGKTTVMLGLLRALTEDGVAVQPFKSGPTISTRRFTAPPVAARRSISIAGRWKTI